MAINIVKKTDVLSVTDIDNIRRRMGKNICLIGFMGSGKSSLGPIISKLLKKDHVDTDALVEAKMNLSVSEIFNKHGEGFFRDLEHKAVLEICSSFAFRKGNLVVSCGGGISMNPMNVDLLKARSVIVKLAVKPDSLLKRLKNRTLRPLIKLKSDREIIEMHNSRYKYYLSADLNVDVDSDDFDGNSRKVITAVHKLMSGEIDKTKQHIFK